METQILTSSPDPPVAAATIVAMETHHLNEGNQLTSLALQFNRHLYSGHCAGEA